MSDNSRIEWTDATWQVTAGCTRVSEGCRNCYAERMARRQAAMAPAARKAGRSAHMHERYAAVIGEHGRWNNKVVTLAENLEKPLSWKKPRTVFVDSMSDLFHPDVPFDFITRVFDVMCSWRWPNKEAEKRGDLYELVDPGHTFQLLTKRPERLTPWLEWVDNSWPGDSPFSVSMSVDGKIPQHIWMGTSCENQAAADERIPHLLRCPAAVRFLSCEPLLGPVDLSAFIGGEHVVLPGDRVEKSYNFGLSWVICGGESGPGARPMHPDWARSLRDQCQAAGVPFFFKSWGAWTPKPYRDWEKAAKQSLDKLVNMWRHGHLAKQVGRHNWLDGRTWHEMPKR